MSPYIIAHGFIHRFQLNKPPRIQCSISICSMHTSMSHDNLCSSFYMYLFFALKVEHTNFWAVMIDTFRVLKKMSDDAVNIQIFFFAYIVHNMRPCSFLSPSHVSYRFLWNQWSWMWFCVLQCDIQNSHVLCVAYVSCTLKSPHTIFVGQWGK